jgi:hypothetical protein
MRRRQFRFGPLKKRHNIEDVLEFFVFFSFQTT